MMGVLWERVVAVMVEVAPPSLCEGEDFSATPVIPADAGIQGHKNNRLPRALRSACGSGVETCFTLGWPGPLARERRALLYSGFPRPRE